MRRSSSTCCLLLLTLLVSATATIASVIDKDESPWPTPVKNVRRMDENNQGLRHRINEILSGFVQRGQSVFSCGSTPSPTPAPQNDISIAATLSLTYFSGSIGDVDRDLDEDEYKELATLMDEFYTAAFQADPAFATAFLSYMTVATAMSYTSGGNPNIVFEFNADFAFASGSAITASEVFTKMEGLNYQTFITDYLFRNPPQNQLDNVQEVAFAARSMP